MFIGLLHVNYSYGHYYLLGYIQISVNFRKSMYLPECMKMVITRLVINIFFMKLAPLDSAHIELSIHAKNSIFIRYPEWSLFS